MSGKKRSQFQRQGKAMGNVLCLVEEMFPNRVFARDEMVDILNALFMDANDYPPNPLAVEAAASAYCGCLIVDHDVQGTEMYATAVKWLTEDEEDGE